MLDGHVCGTLQYDMAHFYIMDAIVEEMLREWGLQQICERVPCEGPDDAVDGEARIELERADGGIGHGAEYAVNRERGNSRKRATRIV